MSTRASALTPAETQIAELVARGYTNPQIAKELLISRRTVQAHLAHIFTKLGLRSRVELAVLTVSNRNKSG
jgi:DNA-binding CsgD family transcriptional regulator